MLYFPSCKNSTSFLIKGSHYAHIWYLISTPKLPCRSCIQCTLISFSQSGSLIPKKPLHFYTFSLGLSPLQNGPKGLTNFLLSCTLIHDNVLTSFLSSTCALLISRLVTRFFLHDYQNGSQNVLLQQWDTLEKKDYELCTILYKLLGNVDSTGCNNIVVPEVNSTMNQLESSRLNPTNSTRKFNSTMLWHKRMGHIREKILLAMHNKGMVKGIPNCNLEVDFCEHYIYGKKIGLDSHLELHEKKGF